MSIIREAITDENGQVDVSYLAMFWVMISVLSAIVFICVMTVIVYYRCQPAPAQVLGGVLVPATVCQIDVQSLGVAIGAICGGFAAAIGGLATYMAATSRDRNRDRKDQA